MNNDYFIILPLNLVYEEKYAGLSVNAIILYCLFLNRTKFSMQNKNFKDEKGVFIYYSTKQMATHLRCSINSAKKTLRELEKAALIKKEYQQNGLPIKIYVNDIRSGNCDTHFHQKEVSFDIELAEKRARELSVDWVTKKNKRRKRTESSSSF
ncbi:MAG: replication initiator protein A [Clostridia bacterium]|nr:replication initiator protein A [Clostridia bacterium]